MNASPDVISSTGQSHFMMPGFHQARVLFASPTIGQACFDNVERLSGFGLAGNTNNRTLRPGGYRPALVILEGYF